MGQLKRYVRTRRSQQYYRSVVNRNVDLSRPYAVYFLHVQPEMTVEAMAFEYQDQVATIRNLAAGLPAHVPLYVKEHKPMVGRRSIDFYSELAHIPGVRLVDERLHAHRLIQRAEVVLTLTGTVGLEAIMYGTPALVLGDVFFNRFAGVYHPQSFENIHDLLETPSALSGATEEEAICTLAAMHQASTPGVYPPKPESKPELSRQAVEAINNSFCEQAVET
jgi:capsule polysaccharide modification protein KpsS